MRFIWRRRLAALVCGIGILSLTAGYALAADQTVTNDAQFQDALADPATEHIYLNYDCAIDNVSIPAGMTVHVIGGHSWTVGGTVTGSVVVESGAILCTSENGVSITDGVFVALPIVLLGATDGEIVSVVTADTGEPMLYGAAVVSGGSATVYIEKSAFPVQVMSVHTDAGDYVAPLSGGDLSRRRPVSYSDMVDATGAAPQRASNAGAINSAYFTASDTVLPLTDPVLDGATFLGWTWEGQPVPQLGVTSVNCAGLNSLTMIAHWQVKQGGSRSFGGGAAAALQTEEPTPVTAETADSTGSTRIPRGSAMTKVSFSDGGTGVILPAAADAEKPTFPWAVAAIAGAAVLAGVLIIFFTQRKRRR